MSVGIGGGKNSQSGNQNGTTTQNSTSNFTPNNLPFLQAGWNAASGTLAPVTSALPNLASAGAQTTGAAAAPASQTAMTGANAANLIASGGNGPNAANSFLTPFANGSMVSSSNPSFQNVLQQATNGIQQATDGSFAADGRYGSGANANAFNSAVANEAGQLSYGNYTQQQQNQLNAASQLSNNNATTTNQQLTAAGLTPSLTSNLFTPGSSLTSGAFSPLLDYMSALSLGNPGGVTNTTGNGTFNSNSSSNGSNINANASVKL